MTDSHKHHLVPVRRDYTKVKPSVRAQVCREFLARKRPIRGDYWPEWARLLVDLTDAKAWLDLGMTREHFRHEAQASTTTAIKYGAALQVLADLAAAGVSVLIAGRLAPNYLVTLRVMAREEPARAAAVFEEEAKRRKVWDGVVVRRREESVQRKARAQNHMGEAQREKA